MSNINKIIYGNTVLIDLTTDDITASRIMSGYKAHDRSGTQITGTNTYDADTSDANAVDSEILNTKTAYVNGVRVTGNMPNRGAVSLEIDDINDELSISNGYHDGSGKAKIDATEKAKIIASNIKDGVQILGVTGTYTGEGVPTEVKNVTPYTTAQTILPTSGYNISQVNVAAIAYTEIPNAYGLTATIGTVAPA